MTHVIITLLTALLTSGGTLGVAAAAGGFDAESGVRLEEKVATLITNQEDMADDIRSLRDGLNTASVNRYHRAEATKAHESLELFVRGKVSSVQDKLEEAVNDLETRVSRLEQR